MAATHNVFLSYDGDDRPWAKRLSVSLKAKGLRVFWDRASLMAGTDFRKQLDQAIDHSAHFVAVWSRKAALEQWVREEAARFATRINPDPGGEDLSWQRRMIFVLLDADEKPYSHLHQIRDLMEADVYAAGAEAVDAALWDAVVEQVYRAVSDDGLTTPIPLLILTTTRNRLTALDPTHAPDHLNFAPPLTKFLEQIGLDRETLLSSYGEERADWRPLGSPVDVRKLLDMKRDAINQVLQSARIRWEPISDRFWTNSKDDVDAERRKLMPPQLAVIVVDPIAIYDPLVYGRLNQIGATLDNENAVFMILPPFSLPETIRAFRDGVRVLAESVYRESYEPGVRRIPYAHCAFNVGDDLAIQGSLLTTLRRHFHRAQAQHGHTYTAVGAGSP